MVVGVVEAMLGGARLLGARIDRDKLSHEIAHILKLFLSEIVCPITFH